jgi:tRNA(Ile)-lysidine synthase TilS/MesJ
MNLLQRFKNNIKQNNLFHPKDKLLLAVSGGIDSVVLCELCKQAGFDFMVAHCNFQLRGAESERNLKQKPTRKKKKFPSGLLPENYDSTGLANYCQPATR